MEFQTRSSIRVFYATNTPSHYKVGMLDAIARRFRQLRVMYLARRDYIRRWQNPLAEAAHPYVEVASTLFPIRALEQSQMVSLSGLRHYLSADPDVLIIGPYSQITLAMLGLVARLQGKPLIIWYESHAESGIRQGWRRHVISGIRQAVLRSATAVVVPGIKAWQHGIQSGVPEERLFVAPHSVNNDRFKVAAQLREARKGSRPGPFKFLFIGRFSPVKDLPTLFQAYDLLRKSGGKVSLSMLGGERSELPNELPEGVELLPFVEPHQIPDVLIDYDAVVLPSVNEVWGLVINEACAAGCPAIVTSCCGSAEIVRDGFNGFVVRPHDAVALATAMENLVRIAATLDAAAIREAVCARYNFENMADGFEAAIDFVSRDHVFAPTLVI